MAAGRALRSAAAKLFLQKENLLSNVDPILSVLITRRFLRNDLIPQYVWSWFNHLNNLICLKQFDAIGCVRPFGQTRSQIFSDLLGLQFGSRRDSLTSGRRLSGAKRGRYEAGTAYHTANQIGHQSDADTVDLWIQLIVAVRMEVRTRCVRAGQADQTGHVGHRRRTADAHRTVHRL